MRKIGLLVCFYIGTQLPLNAQLTFSLDDDAGYVASLEKIVQETASDSIKAYTCFKLSLFCKLINDTVKAGNYLKQGHSLSEKYPFLQAAYYYYKANAQYGKRDLALMEYNLMRADSMLLRFKHKDAYRLRAIIWNNCGIIQQSRSNEKGAMDVFTSKAAPYAELSGDLAIIGKTNKAIAIIYMNADQRNKAASYLTKAIDYIEKSPQDNPTRLEELVDTYILSGENYVYMKAYDSAKTILDKAKVFLNPHPNSNLNITYYFAEGKYFDRIQQYKQAINSFNSGIALAKGSPAHFSLNRLKYAKYETLANQKDYRKAIELLEGLIKDPQVFTTDKKLYYQQLYTSYSQIGDIRNAYKWSERYIVLSDSLYKEKFQKEIVELETKYNNAENQKKISLLQSEKEKALLAVKNSHLLTWLFGVASIFLLILSILGWLYYRNNKNLSAQKELNHQQQLQEVAQRQQVEFAKALLLGEEKERKRLAGDLHDGLGGMLAGVKINLSRLAISSTGENGNTDLSKIIQQLDSSVNELRRIARNMMPETLVNLGLEPALRDMCSSLITPSTYINFQSFDISTNMPRETQVTIYRIVQELLTNAIRHSLASQVLVQCSQNENTFFVTVEDDGKGFESKSADLGDGIGLTNVKSRVDYLNGKMDITSVPNDGTTINIELNVTL